MPPVLKVLAGAHSAGSRRLQGLRVELHLIELWCDGIVQEAAQHLARKMADELMAMPVEEAMPIVRACGHYLNLTSIAETHHR